ncbi:zinc finger CCCH domain-containing protein 56-like, partial [Salvia hispanica]|uniref:zinc finger CCCH domain-containing protein 56-like n=1 Tax=Salvia hispanica TaxID=49212 RepID=UPI002009A8CF
RSFQFDVESDPPNKRAKKAIEKVLYKTRPCFQFRAGSCPFAENCEFAHSMEELRNCLIVTRKNRCAYQSSQGRKSAAICVLPGSGGGFKSNGSTSIWKARLCTKWDLTGMCGYGKNCIFAHGLADSSLELVSAELVLSKNMIFEATLELAKQGVILNRAAAIPWTASEEKDSGSSALGANQVASVPAKASVGHVPYSYHIGAPPRRLSGEVPRTGEVAIRNWKGPDKISKIYGDWIDDLK